MAISSSKRPLSTFREHQSAIWKVSQLSWVDFCRRILVEPFYQKVSKSPAIWKQSKSFQISFDYESWERKIEIEDWSEERKSLANRRSDSELDQNKEIDSLIMPHIDIIDIWSSYCDSYYDSSEQSITDH